MNPSEKEILKLISSGENLTVEFKSDLQRYPDRELVSAVVAMANTAGGDLFLGVEDNGTITGLHPIHEDISGIAMLIANKTIPSISVRVEPLEINDIKLARIMVPNSRQLVSTSDGLILRRRLMANGRPEAVPFYPHEFTQRQSALGLKDPSAMLIEEMPVDQLNPLERERMREAIRRYGGDSTLLPLNDDEFDGALGLVVEKDGVKYPSMSGLLLLGREKMLRQYLPAHEVSFQVLDGTAVRMNEFSHKPLLQTFEEIEQLFKARVQEEEIQVGLFRVPIPNFDRRAFREGFVNALAHRDYARLGSVQIRLDNDGLTISSPGGFVEGVTLQNLLVVSPRSRNPLLADIIKRIGLAERTGRGIDRIFEGTLRYGRPAPDYSLSDQTTVVLSMLNSQADIPFLEMVLHHEEKSGSGMPFDSLVILSKLREERRLTVSDLSVTTQKTETITRGVLEKLAESGLIEHHGTGRGRTYMLSLQVYQKTAGKSAYVRQVGFDPIQQEQMVLRYIDVHGLIKREDVIELCRISKDQAYRLLKRLRDSNMITSKGQGKGIVYVRSSK